MVQMIRALNARHLLECLSVITFAVVVVGYFHDRTWCPPDDGAYAHVAERILQDEVLHRDVQDVHPGYVALARRLRPRHRFECHDGTAWAGDGEPFDLTLVNGVLHHLDDATARALLRAALSHTKQGGSLVVIEDAEVANAGLLAGLVHALDHGHFIRSPETWARLVGEFFRVEESETYRSGICPYHLMVGVRG